jgi:hypothetical protein
MPEMSAAVYIPATWPAGVCSSFELEDPLARFLADRRTGCTLFVGGSSSPSPRARLELTLLRGAPPSPMGGLKLMPPPEEPLPSSRAMRGEDHGSRPPLAQSEGSREDIVFFSLFAQQAYPTS